MGNSMLLFYSRKPAFYKLNTYERKTKVGHCHLWSEEVDGKRGAIKISSILHDYFKSVDDKGLLKEISLYCDSCPSQNK